MGWLKSDDLYSSVTGNPDNPCGIDSVDVVLNEIFHSKVVPDCIVDELKYIGRLFKSKFG